MQSIEPILSVCSAACLHPVFKGLFPKPLDPPKPRNGLVIECLEWSNIPNVKNPNTRDNLLCRTGWLATWEWVSSNLSNTFFLFWGDLIYHLSAPSYSTWQQSISVLILSKLGPCSYLETWKSYVCIHWIAPEKQSVLGLWGRTRFSKNVFSRDLGSGICP